jgi:hypothetical protein
LTVIVASALAADPSPAVDLAGWGANFMFHDGIGVQARRDLWTDEEIILFSGQVGVLQDVDEARWFLDFNAHLLVTASEFDNPRFYLLAGLGIELEGSSPDVGANLGLGFSVMATEAAAVFAEVKYVAGLEQGAWIAVGVHF